MIAAIILAAGASSRMGSPKALLDYHGETFLNRLLRVFGTACSPLIVTLGYDADAVAASLQHPALTVINPDPARGQLSSLQCALAKLPAEAEGFLFTTVDCPAVLESTVLRLARVFETRSPETLLVIPRIGDKRGHPVCAHRSIAAELLALPPTGQARDVIHSHVDRTRYIDVGDQGILADIDDPEAYRKLTGTPQ